MHRCKSSCHACRMKTIGSGYERQLDNKVNNVVIIDELLLVENFQANIVFTFDRTSQMFQGFSYAIHLN
jgi:hypothetical protein